jgi:hypothetical protein
MKWPGMMHSRQQVRHSLVPAHLVSLRAPSVSIHVRRALCSILMGTTLAVVVASTPATAQAQTTKPACGLVSATQASALLGSPVQPQGLGPVCSYEVSDPQGAPGTAFPTFLELRLSVGHQALADFRLNEKTAVAPKKKGETDRPRILGHFLTVAGVPSYWVDGGTTYSVTTVFGGNDTVPTTVPVAPPPEGTLTSSKQGFVLQVTVQGVHHPEQVAEQATGDALGAL